jgi:hypothetical protein
VHFIGRADGRTKVVMQEKKSSLEALEIVDSPIAISSINRNNSGAAKHAATMRWAFPQNVSAPSLHVKPRTMQC